eukprot:TRINITY_DN65216_c0_g1_i1.p2 TRINITY_DN65216_c0_g1~~TRINITY_DN65216_c0_g1_i1.p2  ORF type:complete len:372 (+),score=172.99 TRINITY_DN65216_c0_g1_i1:181-1296(+)
MSFHCNTCGVEFRGRDEMKSHYEGDFHNDNVKRRVNGLVPLTSQAHGARSRIATSVQSTSYKCTICDKRFATPQTLSSHLQSQKHKEKKAKMKLTREEQDGKEAAAAAPGADAAAADTPLPTEESQDTASPPEPEEDEEWESSAVRVPDGEGLSSTDCLFCNLRAPTPEDALCHMAKTHHFTLPLADRVTDIPGLLSYLALKVNGGLCLVCGDAKMFESRQGCQNHMVSQGHCMLKLAEGEYADFYDSTVPYEQGETAGSRASGTRIQTKGAVIVSKFEKKSHQVPMQVKSSEDIPQEKKMLAEGSKAHMTLVQMSRYKQLIEAREKLGPREQRMDRNHQREQNKQRMRLGVHLNNLHGKGYQGDYVGKTL